MKELRDFKEEIHKCSKCALCQKVCPIYQVTGNDCSVSRGQFIMLKGLIKGDLKMTKRLNRYLDLCLKCGKCSEYCPSGIDVVEIISAAKYEYFKKHFFEKIISIIQKYLIFGFVPNLARIFSRKRVSKKFDKKVIYYGGCNSKYTGNHAIVKLLNNLGIEVFTPNFSCCGIPFLVRGDYESFKSCMKNYIQILKKHQIKDIVTTCASCEKTIKDYIKCCENEEDRDFLSSLNVKNIYDYLIDNKSKLKLKKKVKVTYHKPCNQKDYAIVKQILESVENLEYIEAVDYDRCCGLNGIFKPKEFNIISKICLKKRSSIISTGAKYVLTGCFGCETALRLYSFGKYHSQNLVEFLSNNI